LEDNWRAKPVSTRKVPVELLGIFNTFGATTGTYPGMLERRSFNIRWFKEGGIAPRTSTRRATPL
jgi:hypothetical protein